MFSPYYKFARRGGAADPLEHCAINVAVYGPGARRWTMTERGRRHVRVAPNHFSVGPSAVNWEGGTLTIAVDELGAPIPQRARGVVRLHPRALTSHHVTLAEAGNHRWWPIAPIADVEVDLVSPALRWRGTGYFDTNRGDAPIEDAFRRWDWARCARDPEAAIIYAGERRDGSHFRLGWRFGADGTPSEIAVPEASALPATGWRVARGMPRLGASAPAVVETLEDTPFYARSVVSAELGAEPGLWMHESLSLDRFRQPIVQAMLPFRMPRRR